jgi:pyruvate formate lyase activating enzyme
VETEDLPPEKIVQICQKNNYPVIAFTYTEPVVFCEYVYETARLAKEKGIASVMVSNGFINEKPLLELCKQLTAVKIDLKGFSDDFYKKCCQGRLQPVLDTLLTLKKSNIWYEIVVLVVPTLNDAAEDLQKMCEWINKNLGDEVPVHFSRFTPLYKLTNLPPTPVKTLEAACQTARKAGLKFVYLGNATPHQWESTYCPKCEKVIIKRNGYVIEENNLKDGKCKYCQTTIPGYWTLKNR